MNFVTIVFHIQATLGQEERATYIVRFLGDPYDKNTLQGTNRIDIDVAKFTVSSI